MVSQHMLHNYMKKYNKTNIFSISEAHTQVKTMKKAIGSNDLTIIVQSLVNSVCICEVVCECVYVGVLVVFSLLNLAAMLAM